MVQHFQIQALLTARGKTGAPTVDYTLVDRADGLGPVISDWNVATLGALPTQGELDAITPAQITAAQTAARVASFTATSRQKDYLAILATSVRGRDVPAWNAKTTQQKIAAALAEADVWTNIRDFIESNT